jgi:hypothetical protein
MPDTPLVDRQVPHLPELDDVVGVPPVRVEVPAGSVAILLAIFIEKLGSNNVDYDVRTFYSNVCTKNNKYILLTTIFLQIGPNRQK